MHDTYRRNRGGEGTHRQVMKGLAHLRDHDVDVNILCTVNAANEHHGAQVYRYFRDELGATWMQFIPIVELGNIHDVHMLDLVASPRQRAFGDAKRDTLTRQCRSCDMLALCNGGCPKDRFVDSRDGEPGHNYLCDGLYLFYDHVRPTMTTMAQLLRRGQPPARVMEHVAAEDARRGRNDPCPCGNGRKFKKCHGTATRR